VPQTLTSRAAEIFEAGLRDTPGGIAAEAGANDPNPERLRRETEAHPMIETDRTIRQLMNADAGHGQ